VLKAAKDTDVKVIMFTDHRGPNLKRGAGLRDGVLFIPRRRKRSRADLSLVTVRHASAAVPVAFRERPDMSSDGFQGQEIYNRHTDAVFHKEFTSG
jgi:hypothetical protein